MKLPDEPLKKQEPQSQSVASQLPLRLVVQYVINAEEDGTFVTGRVETGTVKVGDKVSFEPAGVSGVVTSISMYPEDIEKAGPGDDIGFIVKGVKKDDIGTGDICGPISNPPTIAKEFTASLQVIDIPDLIEVGYTALLDIHQVQVTCKFVELISKLDPDTFDVIEKNPASLKPPDVGVVRIETTQPLVVEKFKEVPYLGRFTIRDMEAPNELAVTALSPLAL
jgi:elongation factor 1-alpha